ncbi:MAG: hypothetical protein ACYCZF_11085 [Anaerolineae bacterium]
MNKDIRSHILSSLFILAIFLFYGVSLAGCRFPWFTQWYFENRRSDPVRIRGFAFPGLFVLPPCYAGYVYYVTDHAASFDTATKLEIYIDNQGSTLVPSDTITYHPIIDKQMIQVTIDSETNDSCGQAVTNVFQVLVQNEGTEAFDVLYRGQLLGTSQPGTTSTFGPVKGTLFDEGASIEKQGQLVLVRWPSWAQTWKIGDIPTLTYLYP